MFSYEYWGNVTLPAKLNMAIEEFLLKRSASTGKAAVRFFDFPRDAIILGYAQAKDAVKNKDIEVVRRPTGGSHVQLGQNTLAYSFAVPRDGSFRTYEDMRAYFSGLLAKSLEDLGLETEADNKASTININGRVVASHALIWGVESALLHGLIVLSPYEIEKLASRVFLQSRKIGGKYYTEWSAIKNIPALSLLLKKEPAVLKGLLAESVLKNVTAGRHKTMQVKHRILLEAGEIQKAKYGKEEWILERKPPFTREEVEAIPGEELEGRLKKGLGYCFYSQVENRDFKKMAEGL